MDSATSTVYTCHPRSWNSNIPQSVECQSHSSLLDITSDKPMFPDAVQDNFVKSFRGRVGEAGAINYRSDQRHHSEERLHSGPIPPYVSKVQRGNNHHEQMHSDPHLHQQEHIFHRTDKNSLDSSMKSTISTVPVPSKMFRETMKNNYLDYGYHQTTDDQFHDRHREERGSRIYEQQQNIQYMSKNNRTTYANEREQLPNLHRSQRANETKHNTRQSGSNRCSKRDCNENHTLGNQARCSFDDASTIPSEEWLENYPPMQGGSSIPNSIKFEKEMRKSFIRQPNHHHNSDHLNDYLSSQKIRSHSTDHQEPVSSFSSGLNRKSSLNIRTPLYTPKDLSTQNSNSTVEMNIPTFQVVGSSLGTKTTATCSSKESTRFSESDKYLYSKKLDYNSRSNFPTHEERKSIPTQSTNNQPHNLSFIKTPTSSNISSSFPPFEPKNTHNCRLELLQEISMAMDMRQKAKLSQETEDYLFWMNHIENLNVELKAMKFQHTLNGKISLNSIKEDQLYASEQESTAITSIKHPTSSIGSKSSTHDKPVSILKNGKNQTRTIKIRAPSNLKGGHHFTVYVKGEEIKATVPSQGVSKGEIFPIQIPVKQPGNSSSTSSQSLPGEKKIKVRAPADLGEGFIFTVKVKGGTITAPVPKGGVKKGEVFFIPRT